MTAQDRRPGFDAIALDQGDNVATALRPLSGGEIVRIRGRGDEAKVVLRDPIPFGHKLALATIEANAPVLKYGTPIGRATARIEPGAHVHTHNLISDRARPNAD
ncbi:UxaA family hydrolase [Ruegeria marina]|uniref:Altronate dehydratase small subunit n=1 Tax=Ruegeria marina TaxID=639004 RepID=A0A1G6TEP6_9RHOB|nr:UxaA family hydrolase [Ruegeria marina]SDD27550.1 altronate dehydratase small subunit [Ruegeria marina]